MASPSSSPPSDSDDSLLDFRYIPKEERERQKQVRAVAPVSSVTHGHDGATTSAAHAQTRKRPRTVYEQERDAKVLSALHSSGAEELLTQVHEQEQRERAESMLQRQRQREEEEEQARREAYARDAPSRLPWRHDYHRSPVGMIASPDTADTHSSQAMCGRDARGRSRTEHISVRDWKQQQVDRQNRWEAQNVMTMGSHRGRGRGGLYGPQAGGWGQRRGGGGGRPMIGTYQRYTSSQGGRGGYRGRGDGTSRGGGYSRTS